MSFASGAATFNSCNKPGSIVEFTNHLRLYPNDYNALMWRSRAYGIVGQPQNALRDIQHAISVSSGVKRENATAQKIRNTGSVEDYGRHANRTVAIYPNEWTAWSELAQYHTDVGNEEEATRCNMRSLDLATKYNETRDPFICWINTDVGNHWMKKGDVGAAKRYYEAAIESSPTHTVSHINLCICNIAQGNIPVARQNFETAKSLNPNLASQTFQTENFDEYCSRLWKQRRQQYTSASSSAAAGTQASEKSGGGAEGGATGGSGGGNGSGSDDGGSGGGDNGKCMFKFELYVAIF